LDACEARIRAALADPLTSHDDLSSYYALLPDQLLTRFGTDREGGTHRVLVGGWVSPVQPLFHCRQRCCGL
jgi:hypothetical protein